jgi:hypothetical protein
MTDFSALSDSDLRALSSGDISKVSDEGLKHITGHTVMPSQAVAPPSVGFGGRFLQGLRDPINGINQIAQHVIGNGQAIDQELAAKEQMYQGARSNQGQSGFDVPRTLGNVVSAIPATIAGAVMAPEAGAGALLAAGGGALSSLTQPVTDGDFGTGKLQQAALGGVTGGLGNTVAKGLGSILKGASVGESQKFLQNAGVTLTPGQLLGGKLKQIEDKATSLPLVGPLINNARQNGIADFNQAAYARALGPISGAMPDTVGREGLNSVKKQVSEYYNSLLPHLNFVADDKFKSEVSLLRDNLKGNLGPNGSERFDSIIGHNMTSRMSPNGNMNGDSVKNVLEDIGNQVNKYSLGDTHDRQTADALSTVKKAIQDSLMRNNPEYADKLKNADTAYANYVRLSKAASMAPQGDANAGTFTPSQLASAVKGSDKSVRKDAYSRGQSLMQDLSDAGNKVLPNKYPDSGTAGRLGFGDLLTGGALGALSTSHPIALPAAAMLAGAYTKPGMGLANSLLTKRTPALQAAGDLINRKALPASQIAAALLSHNF